MPLHVGLLQSLWDTGTTLNGGHSAKDAADRPKISAAMSKAERALMPLFGQPYEPHVQADVLRRQHDGYRGRIRWP